MLIKSVARQLITGSLEIGLLAGVDRRIPFPELPFNHEYQIFSNNGGNSVVTNVGQLWGPNLYASVSGDLMELDPTAQTAPKACQANIQGGQLCLVAPNRQENNMASQWCLSLPIQGVGIFDILYLGERVRLLQNRNGGGARGIQIKME